MTTEAAPLSQQPLNEKQIAFLERRVRLNRSWPWVAALLVAVLFLLYLYQFLKNPGLVNPYYVMNGLKTGSLPDTTIHLLATLCSVAILWWGGICLIFILFSLAWMSNERKLVEIIRTLQRQDAQDRKGA